jgi:hypothetical protein
LSTVERIQAQHAPDPVAATDGTVVGASPEIAAIVKSIDSVFSSQIDLRDKLAARLQTEGYRVMVNRDFGKAKVDIWAEQGDARLAVEVRYKTALLKTIFNGSHIHLKNQSAQDISRYDFLKDIAKLESIVLQRPGTKGYAVLITNDRNYWQKPARMSPVDEDFRIHQGRIIQGQLSWNNASGGTTENREETIGLQGQYLLNWEPYMTLGTGKNEFFQMLIVEV